MSHSSGEGSRGGNVRSVQEARDLQRQRKDKRDWAGAIDEQIRRTLLETGYFHADDLDPLDVPPEHCNLKGTRAAWFRNKHYMESTNVYRKVSHPAANGRKAPIFRITKLGRDRIAGVEGGSVQSLSPSDSAAGHSLHPGEKPTHVGVGVPNPQGPGGAVEARAPHSTDVDPESASPVATFQATGELVLFDSPAKRPLSPVTDSEAA